MRSGRLRQRVTVQEATRARAVDGGFTETWANVATLWADILPKTSREFSESDLRQGDVTHEIRVRWNAWLTMDHRILEGSRTFEILSPPINVGERRRALSLMCKEAV